MFTIDELLADLGLAKTWQSGTVRSFYDSCNLPAGTPLRRGVLYVADPGALPPGLTAEKGAGLLLVQPAPGPADLPPALAGAEAAAVAPGMAAAQLFPLLQEAAIARMEPTLETARLAESIFHRRTAAQLVHEAAARLQNPVILTSTSYRVLAIDAAGLQFSDPVWDTAMQTGYCSSDSILHFENEDVTRKVVQSSKAFVLDQGLAAKIPRILQKIEVRGKIGAYIGVLQVGRPFDRRDLRLVDLVCQALSVLLERGPEPLDESVQICQSIMDDLLEGRISSATILHDRIRSARWQPRRNFRCAVLLPQTPEKGILNADYLLQYLARELPAARALQHGNGIVLLLNFDETGRSQPCDALLQNLCDEYSLRAGVSNEFRDLIRLPAYRDTAVEAIRLSRLLRAPGRLVYFCDVVFDALACRVGPAERTSYEQSKYKLLAEYDRGHNTEFCRTLQVYLECGCSCSLAAQRLFIHRNTLTHRLEKLTELCGIDLHNGGELLHFFLSCRFALWDQLDRG